MEARSTGSASAPKRPCGGYNIIILSDRMIGPDRIAIPALLATAAVHHHLIRKGLRTPSVWWWKPAKPREVHHFAAWQAMAPKRSTPIWPSTRCSTCMPSGRISPEVDSYEVVERYIKSIGKGILKVMSKMGISTYQSYCGAQIFDAVGLSSLSSTSTSPAPRP
jgi:glutamate synthase (NADPH/NADH) large chain